MSLSVKFRKDYFESMKVSSFIKQADEMNYTINNQKIIKLFIIITVILLLAHIITQTLVYAADGPLIRKLSELFNLDGEKNIPTYFATFLLLLASGLLLIVYLYQKSEKFSIYWLMLSIIFLYVSMDEYIEFHERIMNTIQRLYSFSGILTFAWIIPYSIGFIISSILFYRFFLKLPAETKRLFLLAALLYLSGSIGLEMIGGVIYSSNQNQKTILFNLVSTVEEILEFTGTIIFLFALLNYIAKNFKRISFTFNNLSSNN